MLKMFSYIVFVAYSSILQAGEIDNLLETLKIRPDAIFDSSPISNWILLLNKKETLEAQQRFVRAIAAHPKFNDLAAELGLFGATFIDLLPDKVTNEIGVALKIAMRRLKRDSAKHKIVVAAYNKFNFANALKFARKKQQDDIEKYAAGEMQTLADLLIAIREKSGFIKSNL